MTSQTRRLDAAQDLLAASKAVLLDWDGCLALGERLLPDAVRFLKVWGDRAAVVSNNSTHLPQVFARVMAREGVDFDPARIFLAGAEALNVTQGIQTADTVMVIGNEVMKNHARSLGLILNDDTADVIVLMRDTGFSYDRLERIVNRLKTGARLIVANPDKTHPGADGRIVPETGALMAAIMACVEGCGVSVDIIGKPSPHLFARACAALGVSPSQAVMLGDNPLTDVAGADAFGANSLLINSADGFRFAELLGQ
ncbi:HAD-IIA family hydrolase [Asticcacaulis machinosus]|uniref:HAD-IA family hydrolase n=1 Tax=Asticcacaulis machinosus TaxID=2984211 RepID=A0ABT5HHR7_9CAUL|nr:HAD-IA family hydrolase [Asticcacaulis machinosus]MDC7675548.1 HAD-IA family hydrolase [Asticcacaulis machinosus]